MVVAKKNRAQMTQRYRLWGEAAVMGESIPPGESKGEAVVF